MNHTKADPPNAPTHRRTAPLRAPRGSAAERHPAGSRTYRTQVAVGDVICFDPTGEQYRVTCIEDGRITFEKQP